MKNSWTRTTPKSQSIVPLLQFFASLGEVTGRKKCQKMIHILQECGFNFGFDFKLALYGAYSSNLQTQLESCVSHRYVQEVSSQTPTAGFVTSSFKANKHLDKILLALGSDSAPQWTSLAQTLNEKETRLLEATSTILYLESAGVSSAEMQSRFTALKPHLSKLLPKAMEFSSELRNISTEV